MTTLSTADPLADVACTLPVDEARGRLAALEDLLGGARRSSAERRGDRLMFTIDRAGDDDLDAKVAAWAEAEKACCAFLGFALGSAAETVTLEITAPSEARPALDAVERLVRGAGRGAA